MQQGRRSGEEREQPVGEVEEGDERFGRLPAEGGGRGRGVHEHEREVEAEDEVQAAPRERQVREAVEREGDERADRELGEEEGKVSEVQKVGHQAVAFRRHAPAHPEKRQLRVQPVQCEKQKAFREGAHRGSLPSRPTWFNFPPLKRPNPQSADWGFTVGRTNGGMENSLTYTAKKLTIAAASQKVSQMNSEVNSSLNMEQEEVQPRGSEFAQGAQRLMTAQASALTPHPLRLRVESYPL